jgi:hypothetical protein
MDQWRCEHEHARAWWRTHQSRASSCYKARELTAGGGKGRGEHGNLVSRLTEAQAAVWWSGDGDEVVVKEELDGDGTQAQREGVKGERRTGGGGSLL